MPDFNSIQNVYSPVKKLKQTEILRAIKFSIAAEFEAIQLYQQIMESTDNKDVIKALAEITEDEKKHAGGLYKLLERLAPEDEKIYQMGAEEILKEIEK
ncbi:MAG: ferritin family protein [Alphaproteobacteria bacterium]